MQYRTETETDDLLLILRLFSVEILGFSGLMISISCHFFGIKYSVLVLEFMAMGLAKGTQLNSTQQWKRREYRLTVSFRNLELEGFGRFGKCGREAREIGLVKNETPKWEKIVIYLYPHEWSLSIFFIICVWITQYVTRASRLISTRIDTTQNVYIECFRLETREER